MVEQAKRTKMLDHLRNIERKIQEDWEINKIYIAKHQKDWDKSCSFEEKNKQKYMVTFPYPYMNGRFHLGHAFSFSKCEFQSRYQRLLGKNVLFPFGYHCTGMPIAASANKIKKELESGDYATIKQREKNKNVQTPTKVEEVPTDNINVESKEKPENNNPNGKGKEENKDLGKKEDKKQDNNDKKKDAPTESPKQVYQTEILLSCDVDIDLIPKFADPYYWLEYFPPLGEMDLKSFGSGVDYTRSFITTEVISRST